MKKRLILIIAAIAVVFVGFFIIAPYSKLHSANELFNEGEYEQAEEVYASLSKSLLFGEQADMGQKNCQYRMADGALDNKDYETAIALFSELNESDKVRNIRMLWADELCTAGEYKQAADMFETLGENQKAKEVWEIYAEECLAANKYEDALKVYEKLQYAEKCKNTHLLWAEYLLADGSFLDAAEQFQISGDEEGALNAICLQAEYLIQARREQEVPEQLRGYSGDRIAQCIFDAALSTAKSNTNRSFGEVAGEYGSYVTDVNTQLYYCNLLRAEGIDLQSVYPDGVIVDVDLAKYQIFDYLVSDETNTVALDCSKILVFSREEQKPTLSKLSFQNEEESVGCLDAEAEKRKSEDYPYTVRLEPALMESVIAELWAESYEECTSIVLLEKGYYPYGGLSIKSTEFSSLGYNYELTKGYKVYPSYIAYESIGVFSTSDPQNVTLYDLYYDEALIDNSVVGNSYLDANLKLSEEEIAEIMYVLEDTSIEVAKLLLKEKYPEETVEFVADNSWGNYVYIPEEEGAKVAGNVYSADDEAEWYTDKYMLGVHDEKWLEEQKADGFMDYIMLYMLYSAIE